MLEQHSNLHNTLFACLFEFLRDTHVCATIFIFMPVFTTIFTLTLEHLFVRLFEPFFYLQTCFLRMSSSQSWHHLLEAPLVKSVSCPSLRQLWWKWHINLKWWHVACICVYLESKFWTCVVTVYWNWHFKKEQVHLAGKPDQSKLSDRKLMSRHFCPHTEQIHLRNTDISNKNLVIFLHTDYNTLCSCESSGLIILKEW